MKSKCKHCHRRIPKRLLRAHEAGCAPGSGNKAFEHFKVTRSSREQQEKAKKRNAAKFARR